MIKLLLLLALNILFTSIAQSTPQEFRSESKVAILVGISQYNEAITGVRPLKYATNDMKELEKTLVKQKYTIIKILDSNASKSVILHKIRQVKQFMNPGEGTLLFAFSGHGFSPDGKETSIVTHDTIISNLKKTGLSVPELIREIRSVNPKKAVLFLDACRNNPTPGAKSAAKAGFVNLNPGQGIQVLYSTKKAELSFEEPSFKQGIFSYFLNKGLRGEAFINNNLTFLNLSNYVEYEVSKWTLQNKSKVQKPFRSTDGDVAGSFVLAVKGGDNQRRDVVIKRASRNQRTTQIETQTTAHEHTKGYINLIQNSQDAGLNKNKSLKVDYCKNYANVAALQALADLNNNCGFQLKNSNRWNRNAGPQYQWCIKVDPIRTRNEAITRENALSSCNY